MKVAILGGTGSMGQGLALRLSSQNDVFIGSRELSKGESVAVRLSSKSGAKIRGGLAEDASDFCDAAIFTLTYSEDANYFAKLRGPLAGKLAISAMVPMKREASGFVYSKESGSAAEYLASVLTSSKVAAAFHTIPAPTLLDDRANLNLDVPVAADSRETYSSSAGLIGGIKGLRPLYAGPLSVARTIEGLTPLILNVARLNGLRNLSMKFV